LGNVAPSHLADTGLFDFAGLGARNGGQAPNWLPGGREEDEEETLITLVNNQSVEIRIPWLAARQV
jgi:tRNA 2-thiocytidine biosynthesis protein TtcA